MKKIILAIAAIAALSAQPAYARLGTVHDSDANAPKPASRGIVALVIEQVRISASTIITQTAKAGEKHTKYKYTYTRKECEAAEETPADETEVAEAKSEEPVGPEPLYFGF